MPPIPNHPPLRPSRPVSRHTIKGFSSALSSTQDKKGWPEAQDFIFSGQYYILKIGHEGYIPIVHYLDEYNIGARIYIEGKK
jgi:hypothetical protein